MCHHIIEARSVEELRERHRPEEATDEPDEIADAEAVDDPEPPAEPRPTADD